ncbi:MAG: cytochrome b N-terminal domain-containing protein [Geminicoccaceae bacterium]
MSASHEKPVFKNGMVRWVDDRLPVVTVMYNAIGPGHPTPKNLSYWWNFGSLAGLMLGLQIITGIVLAMHYNPSAAEAFNSVEHIMRDVNFGWFLRYAHANGASMFFIVVYIHIFRGLYYGSYKSPRELLWMLGVVILLCMMATAFMGYVLPWGQMSFWGAKVITNLFSAIPFVGESVVTWLWGGFTVGGPTLNRFFALHYLLPFVIAAIVVLHIWALHRFGSNNPVGIDVTDKDMIPFHPYYTIKDLFGIGVFLIIFAAFLFFAPNYLGHPDNYTPANPLVTPPHIVPEWYFLPFYAILRSTVYEQLFTPLAMFGWFGITAKLMGVLMMFASIAVLLVLPWLDTSRVRSARFRPIYKWMFWVLVVDVVVLTWVGGQVPDTTIVYIGQVATAYYFFHFLILMPLLGKMERPLALPDSINKPVLGQAQTQPAE